MHSSKSVIKQNKNINEDKSRDYSQLYQFNVKSSLETVELLI